MDAPMRPGKNMASAPRNISVPTQALLPTVGFGCTGGAGGSPPPNAACFASLRGSASSSRRAVELWAIKARFPTDLSIHNDKGNHRPNIEHGQKCQDQPHAPILTPHAAELIHKKLTHNGTRSNAITNKSTGK